MRATQDPKPIVSTPTWSLAAIAVQGLLAGCGGDAPPAAVAVVSVEDAAPQSQSPTGQYPPRASASAVEHAAVPTARTSVEKACCKGKNACRGQGECKTDANACKGKNECKGKGGCVPSGCATPAIEEVEKHCCRGLNECKGLGQCKTDQHDCKGLNQCKALGGCAPAGC